MKDIEKLESYVENPLESTVLVVSYKDKKLDARKKFAKTIKEKGVLLTTKKIYDSQVPEWTKELLKSKRAYHYAQSIGFAGRSHRQ